MKPLKTIEGTTLTVLLGNELNAVTAPELDAVIQESLEGIDKVVLDFSQCRYLSSAGLRVLLKTLQSMKKVKGQLFLTNVGDLCLEILEETGLAAAFNIN